MDENTRGSSASERSRWLAELAVAIEQAQRVAWRLGVSEGHNPEALELYSQLEVTRDEVQALRRGVWTGEQRELDPFWARLLPSEADARLESD